MGNQAAGCSAACETFDKGQIKLDGTGGGMLTYLIIVIR